MSPPKGGSAARRSVVGRCDALGQGASSGSVTEPATPLDPLPTIT
jgi:hypothetical protein